MLRHYFWIFIFISFATLSFPVLGGEACGRNAVINYQEVLVDTGPTGKGEGLRYYLSKDKVAASYLDTFQKNSKPMWQTAAISTTGVAMILAGIMQSGRDEGRGFASKETLFIGGASMIIMSYLVSKTIEYNNEIYLIRAIDEYNKRNLPRIYFYPYGDTNKSSGAEDRIGIGAGVSTSF